MERGENSRSVVSMAIARRTELFLGPDGQATGDELVSETLALIRCMTQVQGGEIVRLDAEDTLCIFPGLAECLDALSAIARGMHFHDLLAPHGVRLRMGVHDGEVVIEDTREGRGDVVQLAERLRSLARGGEILLPRSALEGAQNCDHHVVRALKRDDTRGVLPDIEVWEMIWNPESNEETLLTTQATYATTSGGYGGPGAIQLSIGHRTFSFTTDSPPIFIGRDDQNDVVVHSRRASRQHASIEFVDGEWLLRDRSTNGSRLKIDGARKLSVQRTHAFLHGSGTIILGKRADEDNSNCLRFEFASDGDPSP